jgi:phage FluMu gp28-like protein
MKPARAIRSVSVRPAYVPADFAGCCKMFPAPTADGREPLLIAYQGDWVLDRSRLKLGEKSRQIGWTWSEAYGIVRDKSLVDARLDQWISSRDDIQARLFLEDCKAFGGILQAGAMDLGQQAIDADGNTAYVLAFANGLRAHSMSSNPDAQAGKRGGRTLDEFALHPDPRKLYSIAYPGITWGGGLSIFSTHRGTANFFNELITEIKHKGNPKKFSLHTVTLQRALEEGFLYKLQKKLPAEDERQQMDEAEYFQFIRSGCADEESFLQEYCCVPGDDNSAFLSYDLIAACEYKQGEQWEVPQPQHWTDLIRTPMESGRLYIGVDVGRDHDLTVIWVVEKLGDVAHTRAVITLKGSTFDEQEEVLYSWLRLAQVRRCCIDCTGIGRQFTERAQRRFGTYKVEKINFTGPVKEELAYPLLAAFQDRTVRIPNTPEIRADLRAVKKETTAANNIRFTADRGRNGHADRFWALALALHAGSRRHGSGRAIAVQVGGYEGGME